MLNFDEQQIYLDQTFQNIHLSSQEIKTKEFEGCIFQGCNFNETLFLACKFYECTFSNCNLSLLKVADTSFFDTYFENCKAIGINWTEAAWPRIKLCSPLKFYKCILSDSSFFGLSLKEISMIECIANNVDLREADFTEADFSLTDFTNALFNKTNLTRANFTDAFSYNIDVFNNQLKKAIFSLPEAASLLNCLNIQLKD